MSIISLVLKKLKAFRLTVPSTILLILASYRSLTSGHAIELVGICASVVPFICQFKSFPQAEDDIAPIKDVLANYITNLILMILYLGYMLVLTFIGSNFVPSYIPNPHFTEMLLLAICANVVFISALIPICHDLKPMQRMMPGILLCNAQLGFMMMASDYVEKVAPAKLTVYAAGFIGMILFLAVNFMVICYGPKKKD